MSKSLKFIVSEEFNNTRLDKYLSSNITECSRTKIQSLIKSGSVFDKNNNTITNQKIFVNTGDELIINIPSDTPSIISPENIPLNIVYEDEFLIIINKPAGMVVHEGAGIKNGTLVNALLYHTKGNLSSIGSDVGRSGIVHRLDKDTSGLMVACKTDSCHIAMTEMFASHSIKREYYTLVWGIINPIAGRIEKNIVRNPYKRQEMKVSDSSGKTAITNYETLRVFSGYKFKPISLIKCTLETGRTHQIRVHMNYIGNPILGDSVYCNTQKYLTQIENIEVKNILKNIKRQMLHSKTIEFIHPITNQNLKFTSKLPSDIEEIISFFDSYKPNT